MTSPLRKSLSRPAALLAVSLLSLRAVAFDMTKSADDYFHGGAMAYLTNNIPAALNVVTNGLLQYPDDEKLKKLEALLKQQQQQQQQQQDQKQDQKQDQQKQQDQKQDKSQQSKQDEQQKQQDKQDQSKGDQQKQSDKQDQPKQGQQPKPEDQKNATEQQQAEAQKAGQMTPEQAMRVLDTTKGDEKVLPVQMQKPPPTDRKLKDW